MMTQADRFISGVGWNHRYAYDKKTEEFNARPVIFGPRAYVDVKLSKGFIALEKGLVLGINDRDFSYVVLDRLTQVPQLGWYFYL